MLFNLLKNRSLLLGKTIVVAASSCMLGCTLEPYIITAEEEYTRNFIKDFGLIDARQDWNVATQATIKIDLGAVTQKSVKVYAKHQSKYYIVADLIDLSGQIEVPVDLPEDCRDIMVVTNGRKYYGNLGETINCSDLSRGIPTVTYDDKGNPNPAVYQASEGIYSVMVQHTKKGNGASTRYSIYNDNGEYQYFNTQQMAPIVSPEVWDPYYSVNTGKMSYNDAGKIGLLPESGIYNRKASDLTSWLDQKKKIEHESIVEDFIIQTGDDGSFTLFPYYYGTNLKHELGVYLLDPVTKDPIMKDGSKYVEGATTNTLENFVSFPIFYDRDPGDLQVQPHFDGEIEDIHFKDVGEEDVQTFEVGETVDLLSKVEVKRGGKWISYDEYIRTYGSVTHSRVAFHFWVPDPTKTSKPAPWATCTKDGKVTGVTPTTSVQYACLSIPTDLVQSSLGAGKGRIDGQQLSFGYQVVEPTEKADINIALSESSLNMHAGETATLNVTLTDAKGNALSLDDNFDKIRVTETWDPGMYEIRKDNTDKTIKIKALAAGEFWPRVYVDGTDTDAIGSANVYLTITGHEPSVQEIKGTSAAMSDGTWHEKYFNISYFVQESVIDKLSDTSYSVNWWPGNTLDKTTFENVDEDYSLVITLKKKETIYLRYKSDGANEAQKDGDNKYEIFLRDLDIDKLKSDGLVIVGADNTITSLMLRHPGSGPDAIEVASWISTGKEDAKSDIETYYKANGASNLLCAICGAAIDKSELKDFVPSVTIADDADYDNIHYMLEWTSAPVSTSSSMRSTKPVSKASSRKHTANSCAHSSRAILADGESMLDPGPASAWRDVKSFWSRFLPAGSEVASYLPNTAMLARSRGYDITINANGEKWKGYLGVYLKVIGSYDIYEDASAGWGKDQLKYVDTYTPFTEDGEIDDVTGYLKNQIYVVYSQTKFNKNAKGQPSNQISALTIKHPVSGRTFLTFEDMRLTRNDENYYYDEKSSDRDVNDLIFNITNYGGITNEEEEIKEDDEDPSDEAFSWLWAVEDLGATDDFDFNDMVMKITSVTSNVVKKDAEGNPTGSVTLYKKVTFTPLCAGGTLPLYVHYAPEGTGDHYILRPGVFVEDGLDYTINDPALTGEPASIASLIAEGNGDSSELHHWFGINDHTVMINTQTGLDVLKAESCVLYLKSTTGFTITGFGKEGSAKGRRGGLYVTVKDGRSVQFDDDITSGWKYDVDDDSWVIIPPEEGKVSQMFMIVDADTPWRWPIERCHILNPYPHFTEWVGSTTVDTKWYKLEEDKKGYTYPRYDLNK